MYVYANISSTGLDAETFCLELLGQEQVMVFPGTMFADPANHHIRITLLSPFESMEEALKRMKRFVEQVRGAGEGERERGRGPGHPHHPRRRRRARDHVGARHRRYPRRHAGRHRRPGRNAGPPCPGQSRPGSTCGT